MRLSKILIVHLFAMYVFVGMAQATISGSKHDLSATFTEDNDEICVYCHTPHGADSAFTGAPLWNKAQPAGPFTMYGAASSGIAGSTIAGSATDATVNAQSMACLSCHDGVSAVNSVVNAPGSGLATADTDQYFGTGASTILTVGVNPAITNIGTDLTNDHPVSIQYVTGAASLKDPDATTLTGWTGASKIRDLLRGAANDRVECGSCHDPHMGENPTFLRVASNTGSALCLGCHAK